MLKKIRSKYIVKRIFDNLKQNKLLNIIHYNKEYQKLMKTKLKEHINEFLKTEIEITPKENEYGKFINFTVNAQIYFNDNEEDIKWKNIIKNDNVTKIKIVLNHKIKSLSGLFYRCKCIKKIKFIKFNRDDIKDMSCVFSGCSSLEEINFTNFNTKNVNNMGFMFCRCSSLKELNLSNFNTNNVTNMSYMFYNCSSLKKLNLSKFNTNNVTNMNSMFRSCSSLKELNLSNFTTNKKVNLYNMFEGCSSKLF